MIFDMRYLKKTTPLQLSIDPIFLRFIPTFSNRICVVSQVCDLDTLVNIVTESVIWMMGAGADRLKQCLEWFYVYVWDRTENDMIRCGFTLKEMENCFDWSQSARWLRSIDWGSLGLLTGTVRLIGCDDVGRWKQTTFKLAERIQGGCEKFSLDQREGWRWKNGINAEGNWRQLINLNSLGNWPLKWCMYVCVCAWVVTNMYVCMSVCISVWVSVCVKWYVPSTRARSVVPVSHVPAADGCWCISDIVRSESIQSDACIWWHLWWVLL